MIYWRHTWIQLHRAHSLWHTRRCLSSARWEQALASPVQTYISTTKDPYLNLSIEHDILLKSGPDSVVLFLYVNRPSVIIGRNQNPWLEVNLPLLNQGRTCPETEPPALGAVDLVRRRSGGGTVFHDEGNVNWTVICPRDQFTRDKHAEMVVRALRNCGIDRARVNQRHDIVLDQGERGNDADSQDTHATAYTKLDVDAPKPLKVTGSAYKITGTRRALHHGTCLLSSPNLNIIPDYLHSPLKPYIKDARGVQSVSSPVGNILLSNDDFCTAVQQEFLKTYSPNDETHLEQVGEEMLQIASVADGYSELKSSKHQYEQTPQFILSNESDQASKVTLEMTLREGKISKASVARRAVENASPSEFVFSQESNGPKLHELGLADSNGREGSWENVLRPVLRELSSSDSTALLKWLQRIFS